LGNLWKKYRFSQTNSRFDKIVGLVILTVILILVPVVVHSSYYIHLLIMVGINTVLAMTFILLLRTGLITIAIAGFWGIGAYASALLTVRLGLSFWLALPASAVITGIISFFVGYLLVRKGGIGFVILTLVFGFIIVLIFGSFDVFGGYQGIYNIPRPDPILLPFLGPLKFTSKMPYYYLMLFLVLIVALAFSAFYAAWIGRAWRAIGLSPHLAASLGVNLFRYRLTAFVISATAAGLMGSFFAHYYGSIVPSIFDPYKTLYAQIYAILGGIGFALSGPVIGSLFMVIVPEILRITKEVEPIFTGLLVILLVMFLPDGLLGLLSSRWYPPHPGENIARVVRWIKASSPPPDTIHRHKR
jgi:branched-chain amino acid transport system permease protein